MKFSEIVYTRPDVAAAVCEKAASLTEKLKNAKSAEEQIEIFEEFEKISSAFSTSATVASIRHTIDTRDKFYEEENDFFDNNSPLIQEKAQEFMNTRSIPRSEKSLKKNTVLFFSKTWRLPKRHSLPK